MIKWQKVSKRKLSGATKAPQGIFKTTTDAYGITSIPFKVRKLKNLENIWANFPVLSNFDWINFDESYPNCLKQ